MNREKSFILVLPAVLLACIIGGAVYLYPKLMPELAEDPSIITDSMKGESKDKAPDIIVFDKSDNPVRLSELKGTPVIIYFWATWCEQCYDDMPVLEDYMPQFEDDVKFMAVNLSNDNYEKAVDAKAYVKRNKFTFPVYYDTGQSALNVYKLESLPVTLVIDKDGNLLERYTGGVTVKTLNGFMRELSAENEN